MQDLEMRNKPNYGCGCNAVLMKVGDQAVMAIFVDGVLQGLMKVDENA